MRQLNSLYGLPLTCNTVALYVNRALVPAEGIPVTTDALLASAQRTTTAGIGLYANLFHLYWGFPAFGAQFLNGDGRVTLDQSVGASNYLAWLRQLNETPGSYVSDDYGMLLDRFKKGEFAYLVDGSWAQADLQNTLGDALEVAPLPAGPSGPAQPWLYCDGLFANPAITSEQQTVALTVALYMSGGDAGARMVQTGSLLPAARTVDLAAFPLLQGFATQATHATAMPTTPEMANVWSYGDDMILKALLGTAEPASIVAETTTLINEANGK
jgi:arabinogalactan oligomer/maltooligosaccharide transport system substrate-binding protein